MSTANYIEVRPEDRKAFRKFLAWRFSEWQWTRMSSEVRAEWLAWMRQRT